MDLFDNEFFLVNVGDIKGADNQGQENNEVNAEVGQNPDAGAAAGQESGGFMGVGGIVLYILGLIALFYFFAIRPQKKREKELSSIQNAIKVGDWVMTSSGFYGKVVDVADQVFVVEFGTNKGVKIPVRKSEIIGNKEPNLTISSNAESDKESK